MHVDRGWLKEVITLGQSAVAYESSVSNQHQGDKVRRIVRRLLFVTKATGAARDEQLGEHKTFLKASRWVYSRAATGRGAGRARIRTCLRREAPTDDEARSHAQRGQLRERVSNALSNRASPGLQPGGQSGNTTIQSRRVHDRGKPSRAKPDERCGTPFAVQTFEAKTPTTRRSQRRTKVNHTWHGGIHDHADDKVDNRALGSLISTHSAWRMRSLPQSGTGVSQTTRGT